MRIDLQLHSTYSDGYLTPTELAKFAHDKGIKVAAITDHNTMRGYDEFKVACKEYGIKPIVGMELYVKYRNKAFNILWYNYDRKNPDLHKMLRDTQIKRRRLMREVLESLQKRGFKFDIYKILDKYNHYVPLNHVVDDFLSNKDNLQKVKKQLKTDDVMEGFVINEYFKNKKYAVLHNSYVTVNRLLKLKRKVGGKIILCHPAKHHHVQEKLIAKLKDIKFIDGLEIMSPHHSYGAVMYLQHIARQFKLIETGGSDFHRFEGGGYPIQYSWDYFKIQSRYLKGVKKVIGEVK